MLNLEQLWVLPAGTIDIHELSEAVDEMARQKSQIKLYRWILSIMVSVMPRIFSSSQQGSQWKM
jgi:hypothetical protein